MNIFTTEHPLDSRSEDRMPGVRSYFLGMVLVAFILCPFIAVGIWFLDVTDNGGSTGGYVPAPFWLDFLAGAVASIFVAFVGVSGYMLLVRLGQSRR
jgi:hypothetical protein